MPKGEKSRVYLGSRVPGRVRRVHKPRYFICFLWACATICYFENYLLSYVCAGQGCAMLKFLSWISIYLCCDMCYVLILCRYPCLSCLCHACFPKILDELLISQICVLCIQKQILQVHTLWGSSSNIFHGNICLKAYHNIPF